MRRGHAGNVGWRNENLRHFRPRGGGMPHFRPSRGYGLIDSPRFPLHGPRQYTMSPHFGPRPGPPEDYSPESFDRNQYSRGRGHSNLRRPYERDKQYGPRQILPLIQSRRHGDTDHSSYDTTNYYADIADTCHVNSMGDIDERQSNQVPESFKSSISPWANPPPQFYEHRNQNKSYRHHESGDANNIAEPEYLGHRPPSSDHYGGNHGTAIDNSNTFSRSVDDTVDIVRKKLLNRDSQHQSGPLLNKPIDDGNQTLESTSSYSNVQQDQPTKRKTYRQRHTPAVKASHTCDQIKNKIVHQFFMMDKDKIHKLMDNPSSSNKFEYAISSLVIESQNSFNRHLRSVAEKSLTTSGTEFMHNDNNTIYEDTFMKQMQCILEPQDTVLLEDIKPMVLAELSKALQLSDFNEILNDQVTVPRGDHIDYEQHSNSNEGNNYKDPSTYPSFSPENDSNAYFDPPESNYERFENPSFNTDVYGKKAEEEPKPLFERRQARKSSEYSRRQSLESEQRKIEISTVQPSEDKFSSRTPIPVFDANAEIVSDDDDPFEELDRQYHVAVDHSFIQTDDLMCSQEPVPKQPIPNHRIKTPVIKKENTNKLRSPEEVSRNSNSSLKKPSDSKTPDNISHKIKEEIDNQLQDMAKSPLKFSFANSKNTKEDQLIPSRQPKYGVKQEEFKCDPDMLPTSQEDKAEYNISDNVNLNQQEQQTSDPKVFEENIEISESASSLMKSSSNTRKRSTDQRPSHRKEKRKKSDTSQSDTNKQILNKNIIINVNDCAVKSTEKCDAPKSVFNLFFSKDKTGKEVHKENKKGDSGDKSYSDKYVKRKEISRNKDKESIVKKKYDTSSSSQSILSPTDISNTSSAPTPTKIDTKTKLKSIDMFEDLTKKANVHQSCRNTSTSNTANKKTVETIKPQLLQIGRKLTRRHIAIQVVRKCITKETQTLESICSTSRFCQTDRKKMVTRAIQTDHITFKSDSKNTSNAFERMKEIDMEIQMLLQEKFKLYSSLESKDSCPKTIQSLGMAVLNVAPEATVNDSDENYLSEDTIVEEFTNMAEEELEQIALETMKEEHKLVNANEKRSKRIENKLVLKKKSPSTAPAKNSKKKKSKSPNISLIEQIITDDRPLEDIISLDDLEDLPVKLKKKQKTLKTKLKTKKKSTKTKLTKAKLAVYKDTYNLKECSVVLSKKACSNFLNLKPKQEVTTAVIEISDEPEPDDVKVDERHDVEEESVGNDIQFDMLDVSEDIVIGDICEVKSSEGKDVADSVVAVSEEIILDNSQSSVEDGVTDFAVGDVCKMYDYSADENLRREAITVTANGDAVLAIECIENNFLAACLDGNVYYLSSNGQLITTLRGSNLAVTCLTIVKEKYGTTVYTGSLDSRIRYYDLETGLEKGPECNVLSPIQTMDRAWDTVFIGTRTGFVLQFECKNNMLIPVSTVKFSEQSILALRAMKEGPRKVLLVAARSEPVTVKDAQTGLLLRTLDGPKMTVYTLLFEDSKVYCGTSSQQIHVFDYSSGTHVGSHEGGKGAVCLKAAGGLLFAGCYDGCVYVYREGQPRALAQLRGPGLMLLSLAILGSKIVAGYKDRSLYIWKIPLGVLQEMVL